jgi:hypothetical protein
MKGSRLGSCSVEGVGESIAQVKLGVRRLVLDLAYLDAITGHRADF